MTARIGGDFANPFETNDSLDQALIELGGVSLARLLGEYRSFVADSGADLDPAAFRASDETLTTLGGGVVVELVAEDGDGAALLAELEALGLQFGGSFKNAVSGLMPILALEQLPALGSVAFARPSFVGRDVGLVSNQADPAMGTDDLRFDFGLNGGGITVGILSDSFDTAVGQGNATIDYIDDVISGDLPLGINILQDFDQPGAIDEGRAMAQLIYDIVPQADFEFASAFFGQASFAQNIIALAVNSDVVVDDIFYTFAPFFQDGIVAQAVDTVFASGTPYFSSAGNAARASYETDFRGVSATVEGINGTFHDFDPGAGVDVIQSFTMTPGQLARIVLQWDEPFLSGAPGSGGSASDLRMHLIDLDNNTYFGATTTSNIGADPADGFTFTNGSFTTTYGLAIELVSGPAPNVIKYMDTGNRSVETAEFATLSGTSFAHSSAEGGLGVGAAFYQDTPAFGTNPPELENFSSFGDTPIYFDAAGNRLVTPEIRERVDITAPDGTDTTFFGSDVDGTGFPNFFGTSAAAPHAAAVAALMLQADGTLTPTQIYDAMRNSAIDITSTADGTGTGAGYDNWSGHGFINPAGAFADLGITPGTPVDLFTAGGALVNEYPSIERALLDAQHGERIEVAANGYFAGPETLSTGLNDLTLALENGVGTFLTLTENGNSHLTFEGAGSAQVTGNSEANRILGPNGSSTIYGAAGNDTLEGGAGLDWIFGSDAVGSAGSGNDSIKGFGGSDVLIGGDGDDTLLGGNGNDYIEGGEDADLIFGNGQEDIVLGGSGADVIFAGAGLDLVIGQEGNDSLLGQGGADTLEGETGNDTLRGGSGNDSLLGGDNNDQLFGNGNNDTLEGGAGNDVLQGAAGLDVLLGGAGDDTLTGGVGADRLDGGSGDDRLQGGGTDGVRDVFVYALGYDADRINAFDQAGTDRIELDADLWLATEGMLTAQEAVDLFGSLNGTGTILTLDFGGGDVLEVQNSAGIDQATLGLDVLII